MWGNELKISYDANKIKKMESNLEKYIFERQENNQLHNRMEWARELFSYVLRADAEGLNNRLEKGVSMSGLPGKQAKERVRGIKNLCICMIASLNSAVLRESLLDVETAFSITDICVQEIETSQTEEDVVNYLCSGMFLFISHIKDERQSYHPKVRDIREYVFKHMHETIKVEDIAAAMNSNPSYLCRVFRKHTGKTIHQFIQDEKIMKARDLLRYTELSLQEISTYLGYTSQSHFGKIFREKLNMTPNEYRTTYAKRKIIQ